MRVLLVEPNYKNKYPPMGLMKISTYHKTLGDEVRFVKGIDRHLGDLGVDVRMVGKRADLHFGVHHAFDSHKDFHN